MTENKTLKIAFLSTIPPKECGIATFTQDLIDAIDFLKVVDTNVIAINNDIPMIYSDKISDEINRNNKNDYIVLAEKINNSDIDLLLIEHEYGIYGGDCGEYLLDLINAINVPMIATLHTILRKPNEKQKSIILALGEKCKKIITMAKKTNDLLISEYNIPKEKIEIIHHGVPNIVVKDRATLKKEFGFENRQIVSTFGLLSQGKGIEYAIEAISKVEKKHKDILYLILGQTHPEQKNENYRKMLKEIISKNHIEDNVIFVNKYLTKKEIIQYLQMSDIYMTPYLSRDQAVSGTLAYAVGYGRAIISTPYLYATEMLSDQRGLLAEFENSDSLFQNLDYILTNPKQKEIMESNTLKLGKTMYWNIVAQNYINVFKEVVKTNCEYKVICE